MFLMFLDLQKYINMHKAPFRKELPVFLYSTSRTSTPQPSRHHNRRSPGAKPPSISLQEQAHHIPLPRRISPMSFPDLLAPPSCISNRHVVFPTVMLASLQSGPPRDTHAKQAILQGWPTSSVRAPHRGVQRRRRRDHITMTQRHEANTG